MNALKPGVADIDSKRGVTVVGDTAVGQAEFSVSSKRCCKQRTSDGVSGFSVIMLQLSYTDSPEITHLC